MNKKSEKLNISPKQITYTSLSGELKTIITYEIAGVFNSSDIELFKVNVTPTTIEELKEEYNISNYDIVQIVNDKLK